MKWKIDILFPSFNPRTHDVMNTVRYGFQKANKIILIRANLIDLYGMIRKGSAKQSYTKTKIQNS